MHDERGMTLFELLVVVSSASLLLMAAAAFSIPMLQQESMKEAAYEIQSGLQLTRIEAVSRNRDCRFVLDATLRTVSVLDSMGTGTKTDDQTLHESQLPSTISFASPDGASPVTLDALWPLAAKRFQTVFTSEGTVDTGEGSISLLGGEQYGKVSVYGAGGIEVQRWDGSSWKNGL